MTEELRKRHIDDQADAAAAIDEIAAHPDGGELPALTEEEGGDRPAWTPTLERLAVEEEMRRASSAASDRVVHAKRMRAWRAKRDGMRDRHTEKRDGMRDRHVTEPHDRVTEPHDRVTEPGSGRPAFDLISTSLVDLPHPDVGPDVQVVDGSLDGDEDKPADGVDERERQARELWRWERDQAAAFAAAETTPEPRRYALPAVSDDGQLRPCLSCGKPTANADRLHLTCRDKR